MFGRKKKDKGTNDKENGKKKKKEGKTSRILMGFVIGSAIGSVLGVTLSDKENRNMVKKKTRETWEKSQLLLGEMVGRKKKKKTIWHKLNSIFSDRDDQEE